MDSLDHLRYRRVLPAAALLLTFLFTACTSSTFSETQAHTTDATLTGSTVYVYSFLDIREKELGPKFLDQFDLQLVESFQRFGVTAELLRFKNSSTGVEFDLENREEMRRLGYTDQMTAVFPPNGGSLSVPVERMISRNREAERDSGVTYQIFIFPRKMTLHPGVMGTSYTIEWDVRNARTRKSVWRTTLQGRKTDIWKIDEHADVRAKAIVDGVVAEMKKSGLLRVGGP